MRREGEGEIQGAGRDGGDRRAMKGRGRCDVQAKEEGRGDVTCREGEEIIVARRRFRVWRGGHISGVRCGGGGGAMVEDGKRRKKEE
ncbi:hypothetical protein BVRB_000880 [Beta vulgaris subsp. vulgaris]|uniref:Uncharacterized protein n=1 Tax=Beta vulgaris subsp. vulgaris TaxID=3555 RepID=A0A0J8B8S3_BETVV|nr:hypothetical protein BVRB_000880 [Beta vulgaris subsp. vulgaris]